MIYLACDHNGFELKNILIEQLKQKGYQCTDITTVYDPQDDYPVEAKKLAKALFGKGAFGVAICGSGQGICMAMNKFAHVRAGLALNASTVVKMRQHNQANCICLPSTIDPETATDMIQKMISTEPDVDQRHTRRVKQMEDNNYTLDV